VKNVKDTSANKFEFHFIEIISSVNFTNVLSTTFKQGDPESVKKTNNLTVFFALSGSARVEAAGRVLMKLTRGVDFTNVSRTTFKGGDPKSTNR